MDNALSLTLDGPSLAPFEAAWQRAVDRQSGREAASLLADVQARMQALAAERLPPFVRERLAMVPDMMAMLSDADWETGSDVRSDLNGALAYLTDPDDLIPDHQPRYGLLDDALVLEIALRKHRQEWLDWHEFAAFRRRFCSDGDLGRDAWLDLRRRLQRESSRTPRGPYPGSTRGAMRRERHSYVDVMEPRDRFKVQ